MILDRKLIFFIFFLLILLNQPCYARDDWNLWANSSVDLYHSENYQLSFVNNLRAKDDFQDIFFVLNQLNASLQINTKLSFGLDYAFVRQQNLKEQWVSEHRPSIELKYKSKISQTDYLLRLKTELRTMLSQKQKEFTRHRAKIKFSYPLSSSNKTKLFISEEIFYSDERSRWNQNRFFTGLEFLRSNSYKLSLAWGIQSSRQDSDWNDNQIILLSADF